MKWIGWILLSLLLLYSCEVEEPEVGFRVKMEGLFMKGEPDFAVPEHTSFVHRYSPGLISFTSSKQIHTFYVGEGQMEEYIFRLPPGEYILGADVPNASLYGQAAGSFQIIPDSVTITELTDTVSIRAEANCSLILVNDEKEQLEEGPFIIERHSSGYFRSHTIYRDSTSGLYFAYFTPDPGLTYPRAFLWFYETDSSVEEGGMATSRFEVGFQYYINILE